MATVNIGNIKLNWKGAYNGSTAYAIDDVVSYNGSSYVCIQASTGNLPTVTAYWEQMSAKGTDGTDADLINIAGTVQGDLYYNNGGAIARLGAGTSGQFLKTQGTGANPTWDTITSDYVKVISGTASSDFSLQNCFTSDYDIYKLELYNVRPASASSGSGIRMRYLGSGNTEITDTYHRAYGHPMAYSGGTGINSHGDWNPSYIQLMENGHSQTATRSAYYSMTFYDPYNNSYFTGGTLMGGYMNYNNAQYSWYVGGFVNENNSYRQTTGLKFYQGSSTISNVDYALYGLKT